MDAELYAIWTKFAAGVRILIISCSCHSGTIIKFNNTEIIRKGAENLPEREVGKGAAAIEHRTKQCGPVSSTIALKKPPNTNSIRTPKGFTSVFNIISDFHVIANQPHSVS
ncbi:hypothetical protein DIU36_21325 [Mucilaginibacter rubeus]|nr:hypothetical protein DIU36_21325 [Mucilaginibacter rubeus]